MDLSYIQLAKMIDHSLLNPTLTHQEMEDGIDLALRYDVASICILPYYLPRCAARLAGSTVKSSTTIGFPHGGQATAVKLAETHQALQDGCQELDMVVNISQVVSHAWDSVRREIQLIVEAAHAVQQKVKVIFENCYLSTPHKIRLCEICSELQVDWVKTSTGFGPGGATLEDLALMRHHTAAQVQIKAAGGLRDLDSVLAAHRCGASRCGASRSQEILDEARRRLGLPPLPA